MAEAQPSGIDDVHVADLVKVILSAEQLEKAKTKFQKTGYNFTYNPFPRTDVCAGISTMPKDRLKELNSALGHRAVKDIIRMEFEAIVIQPLEANQWFYENVDQRKIMETMTKNEDIVAGSFAVAPLESGNWSGTEILTLYVMVKNDLPVGYRIRPLDKKWMIGDEMPSQKALGGPEIFRSVAELIFYYTQVKLPGFPGNPSVERVKLAYMILPKAFEAKPAEMSKSILI